MSVSVFSLRIAPHPAEIYRLKGDLTRQQFRVHNSASKVEEDAEGCFPKAMERARTQHAESWELRASTSLARFWQQQRKKGNTQKLLFDVYTWFTAGVDTKDLHETKALLEELRATLVLHRRKRDEPSLTHALTLSLHSQHASPGNDCRAWAEMGMNNRAKTTPILQGAMLIQEQRGGAEMRLKP